jgi:hypothetical protein
MTILLFIFEQLFILLVPELVVWFVVVDASRFPSETDFVQKHLSINSNFVVRMTSPLATNPHS